MTLNLEKVSEKFYRYSGESKEDTERAALCAQLCEESAAKIQGTLDACPGADPAPCLGALESWAAAEAFYHLTLADEAAAPESISADGVTVSAGERSKKAKLLLEEKRSAAFPALGEGGFYFGRA